MIVKNEEHRLKECLSSVSGIVDDIVIVDTGSSDNTIVIAKEAGARVFHFNWVNDFAAARNFALDQTNHGWILYLDADETLSPSSVKELKKLTASFPGKAYNCKVINIDTTCNHPSVLTYPRLFPARKSIRFEGKAHEQIDYSLHRNKIPILKSKIEIIHTGYNLTVDGLKQKAQRNLTLLLEEYKSNPSGYISYQIGQSYGILNDPLAENYFREAIHKGLERKEFLSSAYRYIAALDTERMDLEEAEEFINLSLAADDQQPLSFIGASNVYLLKNNMTKAAEFILKAFDLNNQIIAGKGKSFHYIFLDNDTICIQGLNNSLFMLNNDLFNFFFDKMNKKNIPCFNLFHHIINNEPIPKDALKGLVENFPEKFLVLLINALKKYTISESKDSLFSSFMNHSKKIPQILIQYGLFLSEIGRFEEAASVLEKAKENEPGDPSVIFYLISVYLRTDNMEKVKNLIIYAENKFSNLSPVISRIEFIKKKIFF